MERIENKSALCQRPSDNEASTTPLSYNALHALALDSWVLDSMNNFRNIFANMFNLVFFAQQLASLLSKMSSLTTLAE